jgi:hypothetical protein
LTAGLPSCRSPCAAACPLTATGLPSAPAVRRVGKGDFLVEGLLFNMPGEWVVVFDARADGGGPDPTTYTLHLDR